MFQETLDNIVEINCWFIIEVNLEFPQIIDQKSNVYTPTKEWYIPVNGNFGHIIIPCNAHVKLF